MPCDETDNRKPYRNRERAHNEPRGAQPIDAQAIERACEALCIAYARALDFHDQDAFIELFTDDAVLDLGEVMTGREAIGRFAGLRDPAVRTRHVVSNVFVDVQDAGHARGISYLTVYRGGPGAAATPAAVGHCQDRFVHTLDGWRFATRTLHVTFGGGP